MSDNQKSIPPETDSEKLDQIKAGMEVLADIQETQGETLKLILAALQGGGSNELAIALRGLTDAVNKIGTKIDELKD